MMASLKTNQCNGDKQLLSWYKMAQTKLKKKITDNLMKRAIIASDSINDAMRNIFHDTPSNCLWSTLFPNHSIHQFNDIFPLFIIPNVIIDDALDKLKKKVDQWSGVHVKAMNERPKHFKKYWTTSDNWWNRYKAIWIGDYFFYPLLRDALHEYIIGLTKAYRTNNSVKELLYFRALKEILYAQITFNRARAQPLILDQAFMKSECLHRFLRYLGHQHHVEWNIPPNDDKHNRNRIHVRLYAQQWIGNILKQKRESYHAQERVKVRVPSSIPYQDNDTQYSINSTPSVTDSSSLYSFYSPYHPPQPYKPFRRRRGNECLMRFHPYQCHNSNAHVYAPRVYHHDSQCNMVNSGNIPYSINNNAMKHISDNINNNNEYYSNEQHMIPIIDSSMPSINGIPNDSFMEIESRDIDISHSSIFDVDAIFGLNEMSMELSPMPFGGDDIFNLSDLDHQ